MIRSSLKLAGIMYSLLFSLSAFADDIIHITVKTTETTAAGIGYLVEGKAAGGLGKTYTGQGTKNKQYVFGYRKSLVTGTNIFCGTRVLTKDSTVTLVTKGEKCQVVVE